MSANPIPTPSPPANLVPRLVRLDRERAADLDRLTPQAREVVDARVKRETLAAELSLQRKFNYVREPVSIKTFIFDNVFLGRSLKGNIYPAIVDDLVEVFEGNYLEVCLGGSWGWGKSREMEIGIAYEIYLLSCMREPAAAFGLIRRSLSAPRRASPDCRP
jgi:hypothetical protein